MLLKIAKGWAGGCAAFLLALALGVGGALAQIPAPPGTDQEGLRGLYPRCLEARVARLVGLQIPEAMKQVRVMGLQRVRLVHYTEPEFRDEVVPGRLTLISNDFGQIVRAFCR